MWVYVSGQLSLSDEHNVPGNSEQTKVSQEARVGEVAQPVPDLGEQTPSRWCDEHR